MPPPMQSQIWTYFKLNEHNQDKADCRICNKPYSRKGRTTTSLKNHLKAMHPEEFIMFESSSNERQLLLQNIKIEADQTINPLQEAEEQLSLQAMFLKEEEWDPDNFDSKKIDKLIGEMIAMENLPFNFVEGLGFRKLIQELAPGYDLQKRNFFTDYVCKELYVKVAEKVKKLIEEFDYMSFTSNIWSDPSTNASLLCLTCHGIADNFDRSSVILKCEAINDCHAADDITSSKFNAMLSEWNIKKEQVHCLIRGKGSNMKTAERLPVFNDIDCTVHKLQLAICSCIESQENIKIVKQKCMKISSHFNHSTIAQKQLEKIQDRLMKPHHKVFQDCITRCNSTFYMFERFVQEKDALSIYMNNTEINPILAEEWKIIECCVKFLEPFEEASRELSSSRALISSVIPVIEILRKKVDDYLLRSHDTQPIRQAVETLKSEISEKFALLLSNNIYVIATYLDPRYKHKFFSPVTLKKIKEVILTMNTEEDVSVYLNSKRAKRMKMVDSWGKVMDEAGPSGAVKEQCLKKVLAMMLESSSEDENQETPEYGSAKEVLVKELLSYRNKKRISINDSPLKWWSVHREEFKLLSPIACKFLSAPPASVSASDQLFSSTNSFYEPQRNGLKPEEAAILLFIRNNAPTFNFTY